MRSSGSGGTSAGQVEHDALAARDARPTTSRTSAARSTGSRCSAACGLARRSLSSRSLIRSRISARSRSSAARSAAPSGVAGSSSALSRARVSGERSSWLSASSSARLASSMPWMSCAMVLMRCARSPSSSRRRSGIGWSKSPRAEALGAGADVVERPQQAPHVGVGQHDQRQQQRQRDPADAVRLALPGQGAEAEAHAVAVGGGAR